VRRLQDTLAAMARQTPDELGADLADGDCEARGATAAVASAAGASRFGHAAEEAAMMATPTTWDRGRVNDWIMEATHEGLWPGDALPDILIVKAQELGLEPADLRKWIYEGLADSAQRYVIITAQFEAWAKRCLTPDQSVCGHCGGPVDDPVNHVCVFAEENPA
jgi:hypothetical protein